MTQIPGIYVEIKGDLAQLRKDMSQAKQIVTESATGISNSMNNALSGAQTKKGINSLIDNLGTLSRSSKITGADLSKLGVDLGGLQKVTGTTGAQFAKLQSQLLQTQAAKAQERALQNIARQAGLTQKEIAALGKQFGLSQAQIANVAGSTGKAGSAFSGLLGYITPAIAGMIAFQKITNAVSQEFVAGLKAVEDFGMSVAQSTALITTFSQRAKDGDLSGAYQEANTYAKELTLTLEMIDQKTIANAMDLRAMSETFIANGVLLDTQNKKQVEGFTAVANALAIMTQGQNKEIQMRQEIRGLMDGEIRSSDKLGMLLKAQIPDIEKQLVKWREQGTTLENLGKMLEGFNATTGLLENQWATVGSTMETIHNRILRGMFEPVFNDLIKLAKDLNQSLMDAEGNLTPLARGIIKLFNDGYAEAKSFFDENEKGWARMIANATLYGQIAGLTGDAFNAAKGLLEDYGSTGLESTKNDLAELEQQIADFQSRGDDWWEFQLFKDPAADKQHLADMTTEAERLRSVIADIQNESLRESSRGGGTVKSPTLAAPAKASAAGSKASDLNAALQAEVELLKAAEEKKLAIIMAGIEKDQQANQNAYELGLSSYGSYLEKKTALTMKALNEELKVKQELLAAAEEAATKLSPITDKEGNSRPDKDAKAYADTMKKVEDAKRGVIDIERKLQQAEAEGAQAAQMAAKDRADAYKQIEIQMLESQGKTVEAARLMVQYNEESVEHKRLLLDVENEIAGAKEALAAKEEMWARQKSEAALDELSAKNDALLVLADIDGEYYKSLDIQTALLDIEIRRAQLAGALPEQIALLQRHRQELERMKQPLSAFVKGWQDVIRHQKTASEQMHDLARETAQDMQETFSDTFFAVMKGDFEDIGDLWEDLLGRMLDNFLRMIADMVAAWAATEIFEIFFGSGTGISFSASGRGGSGSGIGGMAVNAAASAAVDYASTEVLGTTISEYIMSEVVYPAIAEIGAAITGATSASVAAASSTSLAAGTATPAILDAAATYGTTTAAAAGTTGATAAGTSGTAAGTSGAAGASMGTAAGLGIAAYAVAIAAIGMGLKERPWETPFSKVRPEEFDGSGLSGQLREVTDATNKTIGALTGLTQEEMAIQNASLDAANGIIVTSHALTGDDGLVKAMDYSLYTFDEATGQWWRGVAGNKNLWDDMIGQMSALAPATDEAVQAVAQYVATMNGMPTVADELAIAFSTAAGNFDTAIGVVIDSAGNMVSDAAAMAGNLSRPDWMRQDEWEEAQNAMTADEMYEAGFWGDKRATNGKSMGPGALLSEETKVFIQDLQSLALEMGLTGTAITGEGGLISSINSQVQAYDQSSGVWKNQADLFSEMVDEMRGMSPTTQTAIQSTAQYIAEMHGVPSMAEQLVAAFSLMQGGMYGLGTAALGTAGSISSALAKLNTTPVGNNNYSDYGSFMVGPAENDPAIHEWATGGDHPGGWAMVGERGRELIYTPPSRVYNAQDTSSILSGLQSQKQAQPINLTIPVSVGNEPLATLMVKIADNVATVRQRQGVTGRAYI